MAYSVTDNTKGFKKVLRNKDEKHQTIKDNIYSETVNVIKTKIQIRTQMGRKNNYY